MACSCHILRHCHLPSSSVSASTDACASLTWPDVCRPGQVRDQDGAPLRPRSVQSLSASCWSVKVNMPRLQDNSLNVYFGSYRSRAEAARVADRAAIVVHKECAVLNMPEAMTSHERAELLAIDDAVMYAHQCVAHPTHRQRKSRKLAHAGVGLFPCKLLLECLRLKDCLASCWTCSGHAVSSRVMRPLSHFVSFEFRAPARTRSTTCRIEGRWCRQSANTSGNIRHWFGGGTRS
jgi:hypothetical protein